MSIFNDLLDWINPTPRIGVDPKQLENTLPVAHPREGGPIKVPLTTIPPIFYNDILIKYKGNWYYGFYERNTEGYRLYSPIETGDLRPWIKYPDKWIPLTPTQQYKITQLLCSEWDNEI